MTFLFVIVPLLSGAFLLSLVLIGMCFTFRRRKRTDSREEQNNVNNEVLLSASTFEGKMMYEEIITATNDFDDRYCIGKGGYGTVYKAELTSGGTRAVKKLHSLPTGEIGINQKDFVSEIRALTEIRHRNFVKFYGFCSHTRHSFLVYEYLERGSLATILSNEATAVELDWSKRVNVIKGVANTLSYMHHDYFPPILH